MNLNKLASAMLLAGVAFMSSNAQANITVDNITWDPSSPFDFFSQTNLFELTTATAGSQISGYGLITAVNGVNNFAPAGTELTYVFGGYTLTDAGCSPTCVYGTGISNTGNFSFTGGWLNVYVDSTTPFDFTNKATAANGTLWLSLTGDPNIWGGDTLRGTVTGQNSVGLTGQGTGYFDVGGGDAGVNFDTNSQPGGSDFTYTSSFQPLRTALTDANAFGTNEIFGDSVPEPASVALIGLGLLGMGLSRRNKKAA